MIKFSERKVTLLWKNSNGILHFVFYLPGFYSPTDIYKPMEMGQRSLVRMQNFCEKYVEMHLKIFSFLNLQWVDFITRV